ncbi:MAG TPA: hypothetical protein VFD84_18960 [Candidatus Binatia bacterium]|nr:hypothetical protein [Candidatus Binatia bacterium]
MEKRDGRFLTVVSTPGGFWTPEPRTAGQRRRLEELFQNLLEDVAVPLIPTDVSGGSGAPSTAVAGRRDQGR